MLLKTPNALVRWAALLGTAILVFLIDQTAKAWVMTHLALGETVAPVPAIANYFAITRSENTGAAFSILPQAGDLFLLIGICMIVGILVFYHRLTGERWIERIALGLLLGGVAGNAMDRIRLGHVVDFVHLQLRPYISNVSNLADHAIVLGICILFVREWWTSRKKPEGTEKTTEPVNSTSPLNSPPDDNSAQVHNQ